MNAAAFAIGTSTCCGNGKASGEPQTVFRLYPGDLLIVRAGGGRRRAIGTRALCTCRVAQHWSVNFAASQLVDGSSHA